MALLEVRGIDKSFGGLHALTDVDLTAEAGTVTSLIGPNGAGKTTLFNCISGALRPDAGAVTLDGVVLNGMAVHERAAAGLGRTFQRLEVFTNLTVFENLQVAVEARQRGGALRGLFEVRHAARPDVRATVEATLERVGIPELARERSGDLSTGMLRLLELGRALCTAPKLLLLDEPASGLDSDETRHFEELLGSIAADDGIGILLIEHDVELVLALSSFVHCLDFGRMIATGTPEEIAVDPHVRAAYLGTEDEEEADAATARA